MKKNFFVFPQLALVVIILSIVEMVVTILCVTIPSYEGQQGLVNFMIAFAVIFPTIQTIMIICLMLPKISIDEKGVTKYLFGKQIKFFSWDSICEIKGIDNDTDWIVFCNKLVPDEKLIFNNRKSYTIPIHKRKEVIEAIMNYRPNFK